MKDYLFRQKQRLSYTFRYDPVPGIHKYKASKRSYFRTGMNCLQEKKAWYNAEGLGRAARSPRNLPSDYDDIPASNRSTCWKHSTKKRRQWGGVVEVIYIG